MTVEVATYVADLQAANPPSTDPRSQGDDHLRLIKQVLQNSFGGSSRQFQIPGIGSVGGSASVLKANGESIYYVNTNSGATTLTLPVLTAADAGWKISFIKITGDANPMFIAPPSGTINSGAQGLFAKARRCIPGIPVMAIWDGANWFVTRALAIPIGSCIEFHGSNLPPGYEWPNGQTLSSAANYPEFNAAMGGLVTQDRRGRIGVTLDNLGGASAGRLAGGFITGTAVGNSGGVDGVTLSSAQIPAHQHNVFVKLNDPGHSHTYQFVGTGLQYYQAGAQGAPPVSSNTGTSTTGITVTIGSVAGVANDNQTAANTGGGGSHSNLQPSLMVANILVVE